MFASQFISGENVKPKSPVSALRRWLINRASLADATSVRNALPYVVASAVMRFHDDQPAEKVTENVESLKRLKESQISKVRKIIDIFS